MRAEWFDACSALVSFCAHSQADSSLIMSFKHKLVRLFSMLHASALAELEDLNNKSHIAEVNAFKFELIDAEGIDEESLETIKNSESRVELIFEWIQLLIVENISSGVLNIPAPILSRAFQEIANGMVAFHDSVKLSYIPFPFPYAQTCDFLLLMHGLTVPFVFSQWVTAPHWAFIFVFMQVFILWSLNFIAVEIENPFGKDPNDIDGAHMQLEMNRHLVLLLMPSTMRTPKLSPQAKWTTDPTEELNFAGRSSLSFYEIWSRRPPAATVRRDYNFTRAMVYASTLATEADHTQRDSGNGSLSDEVGGSRHGPYFCRPRPSRPSTTPDEPLVVPQSSLGSSMDGTLGLHGKWEPVPRSRLASDTRGSTSRTSSPEATLQCARLPVPPDPAEDNVAAADAASVAALRCSMGQAQAHSTAAPSPRPPSDCCASANEGQTQRIGSFSPWGWLTRAAAEPGAAAEQLGGAAHDAAV